MLSVQYRHGVYRFLCQYVPSLLVLSYLHLFGTTPTWALDVFDRHEQPVLQQVVETVAPVAELSERQAARLQPLADDLEGTCVVVKGKSGRLTKVLVSWGFRKRSADAKPIPVILFERFVTYDDARDGVTVANGKNLMLFPGFQFDADLGQVVPAGFDAELEVTEQGTLRVLDSAQLFPLSGSQLSRNVENESQPTAAGVISPTDFQGVWQVDGDGRWIGEWDLKVDPDGQVSGKFHSRDTESSYPIVGEMGTIPNQIRLTVTFSNTTQAIDAYLWTKDKSKMAGTFMMSGRKFGVVATREQSEK